MFEILTNTEKRILGLSCTGIAAKEIASETESTENTVNTHLKNIKDKIKEKVGKSYKLAELRFLFLCEIIGKQSDDVKKQIISTVMIISILISIPLDGMDKRRFRFRYRRQEITDTIINSTTL